MYYAENRKCDMRVLYERNKGVLVLSAHIKCLLSADREYIGALYS